MQSYKDLEVWKRAMELACQVYRAMEYMPKTELYGLVSQIQRAAASVPANIAEGWGRGTRREYIQFLHVARGSLMELETHLLLAQQLEYLPQSYLTPLLNDIEQVGRMLNALLRSLKQGIRG